MSILYIAIGIFVLLVVIAAVDSSKKKKRLDAEATELLKKSGISKSPVARQAAPFSVNHEYAVFGIRFAISADQKTAYLLYDAKQPTITVPVSSITGCEIVRDGNSAGSVGRAIAGGIIAGGVGAVVGASTGNGVPERYSLFVYLNDLQRPYVEYSLLNRKSTHSKGIYEDVVRFAEAVSATIRVLVSQNEN